MATHLAAVHIGPYRELPIDAADARGGQIGRILYANGHAAIATAHVPGRPADHGGVRGRLRSVSAGGLHDRVHPRRPRDPARGAGDGRVRRESHRRGVEATDRARARAPVVRQQRRCRTLARHLAQRRFRLLRGMAVVGAIGRSDDRRARGRPPRPAAHAPAGSRPRPTRVPIACSTTASTSGERSCSRRSGGRWGMPSFATLLREWAATHRHGLVTTADFRVMRGDR